MMNSLSSVPFDSVCDFFVGPVVLFSDICLKKLNECTFFWIGFLVWGLKHLFLVAFGGLLRSKDVCTIQKKGCVHAPGWESIARIRCFVSISFV